MKKYIILAVFLLCFSLVFPHIWNSCVAGSPQIAVRRINANDWNSTVLPIISALMSLLVIIQAEKQRKTSEKAQERMERINERMLEVERKGKLGYMVPRVHSTMNDGSKLTQSHPLEKYIYLENAGNDGVFISTVEISVCGAKRVFPSHDPLWVSAKDPFDVINFECFLTDEDLKKPELSISIILQLTNTMGYEYLQKLIIGFDNNDGIGIVNDFNMKLMEAAQNAD